MNRAYALLEIKSIDEEQRTFSGVATTPTVDGDGDIIEPLGVAFRNPLPLKFEHKAPVGEVVFDPPTAEGVMFKAMIPRVREAGILKDRTDEAWHSVKYRVIRGASIGFEAASAVFKPLASGGRHYLKIVAREMSIVTIPANRDATILAVKTLDSEHLAASGPHLPGVTGTSTVVRLQKAAQAMTTAEQITQWSNTRAPKLTRINELMAKTATAGVTLDEAESQECDALEVEVKSIDTHLQRLQRVEQMNISGATPIAGKTPAEAAASRDGQQSVIRVKSVLPPGIEFARYAMCLLHAKGNLPQAHEIAKTRYPDEARIQLVLKAAVAAGTTTDATWAGALVDYQNFSGDFINYLRPKTILGKFGQDGIPDLTRVPFMVRIISQTSGGAGYWVGQGAPKPLTKFDFAPVTLGHAKVANIAVITQELARFSSPSAEMLVRNALSDAIVARIDTDFVDPAKAAVAGESPASITNGLTPTVSDGVDAATVGEDVLAAMTPFITANLDVTGLVWIMGATTALRLSLMRGTDNVRLYPDISLTGGKFEGLPVIVSAYAGTNVILVNAPDIYLADDGQVTIDASKEASLQMLDNPTNNSATGTATSMVSMFQTNSLALLAEREINWAKRRAAAVSYISDVDWGAAAESA